MTTTRPLAGAARAARRRAALGVDPDSPPPACARCGEARLFALHAREGHHVAGRVNDPSLTVVLCLNCHAAAHETMRVAGVPLRDPRPPRWAASTHDVGPPPPTMLDRLAALLASVGGFLVDLGERFGDWAGWLLGAVAALDAAVPTWRETVAAVPGPPGVGGQRRYPAYPASDPPTVEEGG